jgi:DNA-binding NarL/FixJ family response regulator
MMRVMLADNHLVIRRGLRALLQTNSNFQICGEASNGCEAVDLAIQKKPDVVVINVNLPGLNGIEATRQIRREAPGTEVLIFTSENNRDLMREALCAGALGYLLQSAPDEQIITAIETLARHQTFSPSSVSGGPVYRKLGEHNGTRLTTRESEVLRLIAQGHRSKAIALMLGISLKTVGTHRAAAMRKLQLRSVAEVVHYAIRERLV